MLLQMRTAFADLVIKCLLCQQAESFPCYKYDVTRVPKFVGCFSFSVVLKFASEKQLEVNGM